MWKQFSPLCDETDVSKLRAACVANPEADFKKALRQLEREANDAMPRHKNAQKSLTRGLRLGAMAAGGKGVGGGGLGGLAMMAKLKSEPSQDGAGLAPGAAMGTASIGGLMANLKATSVESPD